MIPYRPDLGIGNWSAKMFENVYNAQWMAQAEAMRAAALSGTSVFDAPRLGAALGQLDGSLVAAEVDARLRASPEMLGFFAGTERFGGVFADELARAVRPVVTFPHQLPPVPPTAIQSALGALPDLRAYGGFWEAMRTASEGLFEMMEDAREGGEALAASEYGFADHMWNSVWLASFADIHPKVRNAVVTRKLAAFTSSYAFAGPLLEDIGASKMLGRRSRVIERALEAHRRREYELSIPALFAQIEGAVGDAMFLKELVLKEGNKYYLLDGPGGQPKVDRRGRRLPAITLSTAVRDANLEENEDLAGASEFLSGVLVQRRNDVLHGRDVGYGKAKLSVQALLVLAVLAEGFGELEEG